MLGALSKTFVPCLRVPSGLVLLAGLASLSEGLGPKPETLNPKPSGETL